MLDTSTVSVSSLVKFDIKVKPMDLPSIVNESTRVVAPTWPIQSIVAVNPFWNLREKSFYQVLSQLSNVYGESLFLPLEVFVRKYHDGEIEKEDIERAIHGLRKLNFKVDIYSVGNKDWCFSPQLINGKFSDRKILTSIELYDKDGLSHSRQAPAIIDRFKGNIYCINGMMYPSSKEWSKAINGEFKELKKLYREAIVFEDLIKSLEHVKKYSENELFKNEVGTGYVLRTKTIGSEKFDRIIILKDGNYRAEFVFVDGVLEAFVRFNDSALFHADNGPTIMDNISGKYDLETFPCFYVNGNYLSIDEYEKKYGFEHPSKIIKDLLSEINVVPKKEEEETSITKEVVEKTAIKTVINTIKSDSREVAKRLAAKKISDFSQNMLITILETAAAKNKNFEKLKDFLKSSKGNILIKFFSGISIDLLKDKLDPKYKDLLLEIASEFRIQSETDLSIEIIDLVQGLVSNIDILSNLSSFEEKIRVQVSNFETLPTPTQELEIESNNIPSAKYVN
jgi:hypothetical protein